jgi:hypothetical protein
MPGVSLSPKRHKNPNMAKEIKFNNVSENNRNSETDISIKNIWSPNEYLKEKIIFHDKFCNQF